MKCLTRAVSEIMFGLHQYAAGLLCESHYSVNITSSELEKGVYMPEMLLCDAIKV